MLDRPGEPRQIQLFERNGLNKKKALKNVQEARISGYTVSGLSYDLGKPGYATIGGSEVYNCGSEAIVGQDVTIHTESTKSTGTESSSWQPNTTSVTTEVKVGGDVVGGSVYSSVSHAVEEGASQLKAYTETSADAKDQMVTITEQPPYTGTYAIIQCGRYDPDQQKATGNWKVASGVTMEVCYETKNEKHLRKYRYDQIETLGVDSALGKTTATLDLDWEDQAVTDANGKVYANRTLTFPIAQDQVDKECAAYAPKSAEGTYAAAGVGASLRTVPMTKEQAQAITVRYAK